MNERTRVAPVALAAVLLTGAAGAAHAQAPFPSRQITLVVPFAAGGVTDIVARIIAVHLGTDLKQTIVVENRAGAGGNSGAAAVAKAEPDGHTLLLASTGNIVINPHLFKQMPFDPLTDLVPVALVADAPLVFAVPDGFPATNLKEYVAAVKAKPGTYNYGSAGVGTIPHLGGVLFLSKVGAQMAHVPFRGSAAAMVEVASGQIQLSLATHASAAPLMGAGKVKVLAVAGRQRISSLPEMPTTAEAGFPDLLISNWTAVFGPKGLSPAIAEDLNRRLQAIFAAPDNARLLEVQGITPIRMAIAPFAQQIRSEYAQWKAVVAESKVEQQ
jgi:tripartite-type tricarboxylate transporter receptor subunit TctC